MGLSVSVSVLYLLHKNIYDIHIVYIYNNFDTQIEAIINIYNMRIIVSNIYDMLIVAIVNVHDIIYSQHSNMTSFLNK